MVLYSMNTRNKNITIETKNIKEGKEEKEVIPDINSSSMLNYSENKTTGSQFTNSLDSQTIKLELENQFLTFKDSMNESFQIFKDKILSMVTELKDSVSTLSTKVSVLAKEMDMIKMVGSTAIGIIIAGFSFLYTQTNQVRQEMNTKFDKIDEKFNKIDEKFNKLYDLILKNK